MTDATRATLRDIATAYDALSHTPTSPRIERAYSALRDDLARQWATVRQSFDVVFTPFDPYETSAAMMADMSAGRLRVFTGADMPADHPMLTLTLDGRPLNHIFRACHDVTHYHARASFGASGELAVFARSVLQCQTWASVEALASETLAQNAWINFGPHAGERPRVYAEQKACILPAHLIDRALQHARGIDL